MLENFSKINVPYLTLKIDNEIPVRGKINYEAKKLVVNFDVLNLSTKKVLGKCYKFMFKSNALAHQFDNFFKIALTGDQFEGQQQAIKSIVLTNPRF